MSTDFELNSLFMLTLNIHKAIHFDVQFIYDFLHWNKFKRNKVQLSELHCHKLFDLDFKFINHICDNPYHPFSLNFRFSKINYSLKIPALRVVQKEEKYC